MALTTVQLVRRKHFFVLLGILFISILSQTFVGRTMEGIRAGWWRRPQPRL